MQRRVGKGRKGRVLSRSFAGLEALEDRRLLAAPSILDLAIPAPTVPVGKSLILPLAANDTDGDALTYEVISSSSNLTVQRHTANPYLRLTVAGYGVMEFEMLRDVAPDTVDTILGMVQAGYYDGLIFHRVMPNFMIQGGDPLGTGSGGPGFQFADEFNANAIFSGRYQLAMANSGDDTNGSQFFITDASTRHLDFNHTIFGQLVRGASVVTAIATAPVNADGTNGTPDDTRPTTPIVITSAEVIQNTTDEVVTLFASAAGNYSVTVRVSDGTSTAERAFGIAATAEATNNYAFLHPLPDLTTPAGQPVQFTASATDIDTAEKYYFAWVLQDGLGATNATMTQASEWSPNFTITPNPGYTGPVDVRVGTWRTGSDWDTQIIRIAVGDLPITPVVRQIGALAGQATTIRAAGFTDADPAGTAGQYTAQINWGDGHLGNGTITANAGGGFIVTGTNTWTNPGNYPVTVTITGTGGVRSIVDTVAVVTGPSPTILGTEGTPLGRAGSLINTAGAAASVDWGLGGPAQALAMNASGGFTLNGAYPDNGTYLATVLITDGFGTYPARYVRILVQNAAPSVNISSVTPAREGETTTVYFTATDPSSADAAAGLPLVINWGDGSAAEPLATGSTSANHTYAAAGTYPISITATDKDSAQSAPATHNASVWPAGFEPQTRALAVLQGQTSTLRVATFTHATPSAPYTAQINWGDGQTTAATVTSVAGGFTVTGDHSYASAGQHTVAVTISDGGGVLGIIEAAVDVVAPGGVDATPNEGSPVGYASSLPAGINSATVDYGDGQTPLALSGGAYVLDRVFADNGTQLARITATDEFGPYVAKYVRIAVQNVAPSAAVTASSTQVMLGNWQGISFAAADPSSVDAATGLSMLIDWNDGTPAEVVPASAASAWHLYAAPGSYIVTVRAMDKDGAAGTPQAAVLSVRSAEVIIDPGDKRKTALFIKGTEAGDVISILPGAKNQAGVVYNGVGLGFFTFTGRILVYGNGGNDTITVSAKIKTTAELHGGLGDDVLTGGAGADIIVGDAGNDILKGGNGRNILIGGLGVDKIYGGKNEDLLIAGRYKYEANSAMLAKALTGWIKNAAVDARLFSKKTVLDDKASDLLTGSSAADAFFANTDKGVKDKIRDLRGEDLYEI